MQNTSQTHSREEKTSWFPHCWCDESWHHFPSWCIKTTSRSLYHKGKRSSPFQQRNGVDRSNWRIPQALSIRQKICGISPARLHKDPPSDGEPNPITFEGCLSKGQTHIPGQRSHEANDFSLSRALLPRPKRGRSDCVWPQTQSRSLGALHANIVVWPATQQFPGSLLRWTNPCPAFGRLPHHTRKAIQQNLWFPWCDACPTPFAKKQFIWKKVLFVSTDKCNPSKKQSSASASPRPGLSLGPECSLPAPSSLATSFQNGAIASTAEITDCTLQERRLVLEAS